MERKWGEWQKHLMRWKEWSLSKMGTVLLAGVLLFLVSGLAAGKSGLKEEDLGKDEQNFILNGADDNPNPTQDNVSDYLRYQEERLAGILSEMSGVGKVEVMFTAESGGERVVLTDNPISQSHTQEQDAAGGTRVITESERDDKTVYESKGSDQTPYVIKELQPQLSGVLILAEGAGSSTVKTEIVEAVEALFGIPVHRIKVIKRRGQ